jgi:hypothetical protein
MPVPWHWVKRLPARSLAKVPQSGNWKFTTRPILADITFNFAYLCGDNLTCMHEDFHCLDLRERAHLILKKGQHLLTTDFYGAAVKLYHLKMRFVEIYHHPVTGKIMRASVATSEDLNKHLRGITV